MKNDKYTACWYCDNILDHPEQVGLLYLGFPRCFVLIPNSRDFSIEQENKEEELYEEREEDEDC